MGVPPGTTGTETSEPEVLAQLCNFSAGELKWVPKAGDALVKARLVRSSGGARLLLLGEQKVALADVRMITLLSPGFSTMQIKDVGHTGLRCEDESAFTAFMNELTKCKADYERFEQYDQSSVQSYFQYYAKLSNQQNMMQDAVRTSLYRQAIVSNPTDFGGAKVMDIGAGSGILSFFSAQAGAAKVYAVEASSAADTVKALAASNKQNLGEAEICVIQKPLETITDEVDGKVDVLVSEPIGTFLFNERMIESYICARDRFLKPGGKMFPNVGTLMIAPFSDAVLHAEQQSKNAFWKNTSFYGLDLSAAVPRSTKEHFTQPIVDYIDPGCLVSEYITTRFDFATVTVESLQNIEIPFNFPIHQPCLVHGIAGWFDALFEGTDATVVLSTAPWCPGTHWYQIRFLLETPLAVNAGQVLEGTLKMEANNVQSYFIRINMRIKGTNIESNAQCIDLKDPEYRFFTSASSYCPPGTASAFGQPAASTLEQALAEAQAVPQGQPLQPQQPQHAPPVKPSGDAKVNGSRYTARSRSPARTR
mmetsp:Transcript_2025/g.5829  ORF Transcript_2025/g.5829 Transcript_2025/m.5829 type:complete len:535 (-) Transcript_2025:157-1761(-)